MMLMHEITPLLSCLKADQNQYDVVRIQGTQEGQDAPPPPPKTNKKCKVLRAGCSLWMLILELRNPSCRTKYEKQVRRIIINKKLFSKAIFLISHSNSCKKNFVQVSVLDSATELDSGSLIQKQQKRGVKKISYQTFSEATNFTKLK
jgi:hypothetical protein